MIKRHSLVLSAIALAVVYCGKPKQREVTELELDDKAVELKADALAAMTTQLRTSCEHFFLSPSVRVSVRRRRARHDMSEKKAKLTLAMIDACRDNPCKTASRNVGERGLAATTAATGQVVIFSAGAGQLALDKLGPSDTKKWGVYAGILEGDAGARHQH